MIGVVQIYIFSKIFVYNPLKAFAVFFSSILTYFFPFLCLIFQGIIDIGLCKEQEGRVGGKNSLYFSLIHYEYIYIYIYIYIYKTNLNFLINYNSIRQVS